MQIDYYNQENTKYYYNEENLSQEMMYARD